MVGVLISCRLGLHVHTIHSRRTAHKQPNTRVLSTSAWLGSMVSNCTRFLTIVGMRFPHIASVIPKSIIKQLGVRLTQRFYICCETQLYEPPPGTLPTYTCVIAYNKDLILSEDMCPTYLSDHFHTHQARRASITYYDLCVFFPWRTILRILSSSASTSNRELS